MKYAVVATDPDGHKSYLTQPCSYSIEFSKARLPKFYWTSVPNWVDRVVANKYANWLRENPTGKNWAIQMVEQTEATVQLL